MHSPGLAWDWIRACIHFWELVDTLSSRLNLMEWSQDLVGLVSHCHACLSGLTESVVRIGCCIPLVACWFLHIFFQQDVQSCNWLHLHMLFKCEMLIGGPSRMYVCSEERLRLQHTHTTHQEAGLWEWMTWGECHFAQDIAWSAMLSSFSDWCFSLYWCCCPWVDYHVHSYWKGVVWTATLSESRSALFTWHHETTFPNDIQVYPHTGDWFGYVLRYIEVWFRSALPWLVILNDTISS